MLLISAIHFTMASYCFDFSLKIWEFRLLFLGCLLVLRTCGEIALFFVRNCIRLLKILFTEIAQKKTNIELRGHFVGKCTYPCFFACNLCDYSLFNPFFITWMANYFYTHLQNVIKNYSIERHWLSLDEETSAQLFKVIRNTSCWFIFLTSPAF